MSEAGKADTSDTADTAAVDSAASSSPALPPGSVRWVADETDAGQRADVVLGQHIHGLSRRQARALARDGRLRVDGRRAPPSTRVHPGQELLMDLGHDKLEAGLGPDALEVLAATEHLIYVAKPAGVHTVALTPGQPGVLATAVAARFPECAQASLDPREGGAIHRLDRPTSGVVAFARSRSAWEQARQGFGEERVIKHYLAVTHADLCEQAEGARQILSEQWPPPLPSDGLRGWLEPAPEAVPDEPPFVPELPAGSVDLRGLSPLRVRAALGRDERPKLCAVRLDGRRARTLVHPLAQRGGHVLVRLVLETGRRHQARVHLAWISLPILGDRNYASPAPTGAVPSTSADSVTKAIHLHAFALDLSGVFEGEAVVIAPLPPDFWPAPTSDPAQS